MSTSRTIIRLAAATAVGIALAGTTAAPALAAGFDVSLNEVPSSFTAGGQPDAFTVELQNNTNKLVTGVMVGFAIQLDGLTASNVRIHTFGADLTMRDEGDRVVATDPHSRDLPKGARTEIGYAIEFLTGAPQGRATLTAYALARGGNLDQASDPIDVEGGPATPTPTAAPTPTDTNPLPTDSATPYNGATSVPPGITGALANNNTPGSGAAGIPVGLYVMGGLLVGVGGVILWMLYTQRPQPASGGDTHPDLEEIGRV
jgi:hypothetical protein